MSDGLSPLAPLRNRDFSQFWITSQVSNFGGLVQGIAAGRMMTRLTADPGMIDLVQA